MLVTGREQAKLLTAVPRDCCWLVGWDHRWGSRVDKCSDKVFTQAKPLPLRAPTQLASRLPRTSLTSHFSSFPRISLDENARVASDATLRTWPRSNLPAIDMLDISILSGHRITHPGALAFEEEKKRVRVAGSTSLGRESFRDAAATVLLVGRQLA